MENSIQMAEGIFGRCQTCLRNMMKGICGLACDPEQDKYVKILEERYSSIFQKNYVHRVEYLIDEQHTIDAYESCKQVVHPSSGRQAMELACGTEAAKCTPAQWYFFMGDPAANPLVPFKIEYVNSTDDPNRFTSDTKRCEEAYDGSYACSCVDCAQSCPSADPPLPDDPGYLIFDLNGTTFIVAIAIGGFGVICLLFGAASGVRFQDLPKSLGGFEEVNTTLSRFFRWWGRSESISRFKKVLLC